jgi:DNA-binding MarR family transcriptional regulator
MAAIAEKSPPTSAASPPGGGYPAGVSAIAETFSQLMRAFTKAKARMLQSAQDDVEWASHVLLRSLGVEGPMRASALAESVQSDPSTVSRQVASLVKDGLIERRADPGDGRACLLVPTESGRAMIAQRDELRLAYFAGMFSAWTADEIEQFGLLLIRFNDAYETASNKWMSDRPPVRSNQSRGTSG